MKIPCLIVVRRTFGFRISAKCKRFIKKDIYEERKTLENRGQNKMINKGNMWHVMLCRLY